MKPDLTPLFIAIIVLLVILLGYTTNEILKRLKR